MIQGGTRPNVIPAAAEAVFQIRLATHADTVKSVLETAIAGEGTVEYLSVHQPVRLLAVEGFEHRVVRFTTDIPYLSRWGQALLLGPGSIFDAHTDSERIHKDQLKRAVELYASLARTLISREAQALKPANCSGARS
jgi:acetylornithine deacetylase